MWCVHIILKKWERFKWHNLWLPSSSRIHFIWIVKQYHRLVTVFPIFIFTLFVRQSFPRSRTKTFAVITTYVIWWPVVWQRLQLLLQVTYKQGLFKHFKSLTYRTMYTYARIRPRKLAKSPCVGVSKVRLQKEDRRDLHTESLWRPHTLSSATS